MRYLLVNFSNSIHMNRSVFFKIVGCIWWLFVGLPMVSTAQSGQWFVASEERVGELPDHVVQTLALDKKAVQRTMRDRPRFVKMALPVDLSGAGYDEPVDMDLELVEFVPGAIPVTLHGSGGQAEWTSVEMEFLTYRVKDDHWSGFVVLEEDRATAVVKQPHLTLEIAHVEGEIHVVHHVEAAERPVPFECGVVGVEDEFKTSRPSHGAGGNRSDTLCVEFALDIDHITYNAFDTFEDAVIWAIIYLFGASEVFVQDLDGAVKFQPVHVNVWIEEEPWADLVGMPGDMLDDLSSAWNNDPVLSVVPRDLVHLFTIRHDTGVGGIAWLGTLCGGLGVAFSNSLSSTAIDYPNTTWGLGTITHEIGHNFGSRHTHWCGWPGGPDHPNGMSGGPIDNCVDVDGDCPNFIVWQAGTIMSYCGGLNFHPVVKEVALLPALDNASCVTSCGDFVSPLDLLGCTDDYACNYDPEAAILDDSCIFPASIYVDCDGVCFVDEDADGICDPEDECVGPCPIPNVFSPDGRHVNNSFPVRDLGGYPGSVLMIFNRYGIQVWQGSSPSNSDRIVWRGEDANGDPCAEGMYFWVLHRSDGEKMHGPISLFR